MAVTPIRSGAAVDEKFFAGFQTAALEDVVPDGEERLRNGGGFDEGERVGLFDAAWLGSDGIFGVAAAIDQRQDCVTLRETLHAVSKRRDHARNFETRKLRVTFGRRI